MVGAAVHISNTPGCHPWVCRRSLLNSVGGFKYSFTKNVTA
jgi:hypothetical protein